MPSPPPSPDNDYLVSNTTALDAATVNAILGSIGARLRAREALEADFEDLIGAGLAQAIAAVQTAIAPYAEEAQTAAAQITAYLIAYQNDANPIRDAVLIALLGGVDARGDTLAKLQAQIDGFDITSIAGLTAALAAKAPLASPALTGSPTAPTAALGTNTTQIATTSFVAAAIAALVASSPSTLDTLNELANALGNDPNFATTVLNALGLRVRVDAAQSLTGPQQAQGRVNLGLGSLSTQNSVTAADLPAGASAQIAVLDVAAGATIEHQTALATAGFEDFSIHLDNLRSSVDNDTLVMELFDGSAWITANYAFQNTGHNPGGLAGEGSNNAAHMRIGRQNTIKQSANFGVSSRHGIRVARPSAGSYRSFEGLLSSWTSGPNWETITFTGHWQSNSAFTGFRLRFLGGTISGRVRIIGHK